MRPPAELHTDRLLLRRWRRGDARALKAALDISVDALRPWIPKEIAEPAPIPQMETLLRRFAADFDAGREWRYGVFLPDQPHVLGGMSLHPRDAHRRVPIDDADRIEIGYWLRTGLTGKGYATEAARALFDIAVALPGMRQVEIRCNARNTPSVAVARRLGFVLASTEGERMLWAHRL